MILRNRSSRSRSSSDRVGSVRVWWGCSMKATKGSSASGSMTRPPRCSASSYGLRPSKRPRFARPAPALVGRLPFVSTPPAEPARFADIVDLPDGETVIWRYMPMLNYLDVLHRRALWFSRIDCLGDPFESSVTLTDIAAREAMIASGTEGMTDEQAETFRKSFMSSMAEAHKALFVSCWYGAADESDAMWRLYMRDVGVAIKATVSGLRAELDQDDASAAGGGAVIGRVRYIDYDTDSTQRPAWINTLLPAFHKRTAFSHECEIRAVLHQFDWAMEDGTPPIDYGREAPLGLSVPVDPERLITEVRVNPVAPDWLLETVEAVTGKYGVSAPVLRSDISSRRPIR